MAAPAAAARFNFHYCKSLKLFSKIMLALCLLSLASHNIDCASALSPARLQRQTVLVDERSSSYPVSINSGYQPDYNQLPQQQQNVFNQQIDDIPPPIGQGAKYPTIVNNGYNPVNTYAKGTWQGFGGGTKGGVKDPIAGVKY